MICLYFSSERGYYFWHLQLLLPDTQKYLLINSAVHTSPRAQTGGASNILYQHCFSRLQSCGNYVPGSVWMFPLFFIKGFWSCHPMQTSLGRQHLPKIGFCFDFHVTVSWDFYIDFCWNWTRNWNGKELAEVIVKFLQDKKKYCKRRAKISADISARLFRVTCDKVSGILIHKDWIVDVKSWT